MSEREQENLFGPDVLPYRGQPPSVRGSDTSEGAAASMRAVVSGVRLAVYREIRICGVQGATCDEIEVALNLRHQSASARVRELVLMGKIWDSKRKRRTRSDRPAAVYVIRE